MTAARPRTPECSLSCLPHLWHTKPRWSLLRRMSPPAATRALPLAYRMAALPVPTNLHALALLPPPPYNEPSAPTTWPPHQAPLAMSALTFASTSPVKPAPLSHALALHNKRLGLLWQQFLYDKAFFSRRNDAFMTIFQWMTSVCD
jgi:hypothetical protein